MATSALRAPLPPPSSATNIPLLLPLPTATPPLPSAEPQSTLHVPTIDISPYLSDPTSAASAKIISTIRSACLSTGFFQITGHGISRELQASVFSGARRFFALPFATKKALDAKTVRGHRGYDVLASQSYVAGVAPDLKEGFYVGADLPAADPRVQAGRFFMGQNVWPAEEVLPAAALRLPAEQYHAALTELSKTVLAMVAATLPYGPAIFDHFVAGCPITPMRLLHYPPMRAADEAEQRAQYGASAHTDFGAITLLLQGEEAGLEVLDAAGAGEEKKKKEEGRWVGVPPDPDAYVVNVGDMLSRWTGGRYVSSVHRVVNRSGRDRYSVVFFFDGNADTELRALDGSDAAKQGVLTVEEHMLRRMSETYGKGK